MHRYGLYGAGIKSFHNIPGLQYQLAHGYMDNGEGLISPPQIFSPPTSYVSIAVLFVYTYALQVDVAYEKIPMVARVSISDYYGRVLLDTFVQPTHHVDDYRIAETGLQYEDLASAPSFSEVQQHVFLLVRNKILVGHRLWSDLSLLGISHSALDTRDLALFRPLRKRLKSRSVVDLPTLFRVYVGGNIHLGTQDSLALSRAAMELFMFCEVDFERVIESGAWPCDLAPARYAQYYL